MDVRSLDQLIKAHHVMHLNDCTDRMWHMATLDARVSWNGTVSFTILALIRTVFNVIYDGQVGQ